MACTLCGSTETIIILERKIIDGIGNLTYKWVGLKNIVYNTDQICSFYPTTEMWVDRTNNCTWKKDQEYTARGNWGSIMNR